MKLVYLLLLIAMLGCTKKNSSLAVEESPVIRGVREFKIDTAKLFVQISVYGVYMGTDDVTFVKDYLDSSKSEGFIRDYKMTASGIEGGGTYCAELNQNADNFFAGLLDVPTSDKTNYTVASVDSCR